MEGKSRVPEVTIVPAPRPAAGAGSVDAAKAAGKEPISPGTPSSADAGRGRSGKERRAEEGVSLPGWKLDALCQESCPSPAMRARFLYF
ncbi:hypothetical protein SETIT_5G017100v2 [Setaria italica]|uniref:Uncharacterized protein n=1 Tax=Setaria italica TaxID=4555 RepID=K3XT59_SETIT|nr:uncharacterized protein LOC101764748 [Setaria italica]RCV23570.1 hypothetical protein SETIT_5G017100v2 [Setaria italica]